jgi:hypothetical protein
MIERGSILSTEALGAAERLAAVRFEIAEASLEFSIAEDVAANIC